MESIGPSVRQGRSFYQRMTILTALLGAVWGRPLFGAAEDGPTEAYEIVASVAVTVLPEPIRPFFAEHLDLVKDFTVTGSASSGAGDLATGADEVHHIMLDVGAGPDDAEARRRAACQFPHDREAARKLFKRNGVRAGGVLPWLVQDRYRRLVQAFRDRDGVLILEASGDLLRSAADASLPFNTTADRDGRTSGHLGWRASDVRNGSEAHRSVRHRFHVGLIRRFRRQFEYEVRVWPNRFRHVSEPAEAAFETLLEAHACLPSLLGADAELVASLRITDAASFLASSELYYARLAGRAGPVMESRLEAGALLGANLVGSAWTEAGSPPLTHMTARMAPQDQTKPAPANPEVGFVGSRNSTVFHRLDCPHVKRIRPENRVHFTTIEEAQAAGRVPCQACQPDRR